MINNSQSEQRTQPNNTLGSMKSDLKRKNLEIKTKNDKIVVQNPKEYNTVVLAGLLHDIGKFFSRRRGKIQKHPLASVKFIEEEPKIAEILNKLSSEIDLGLLKTLVQHHHEYYGKKKLKETLKVQEIPDHHKRSLAYIVSKADNYSSSERYNYEKLDPTHYTKYRIHSGFSLINTSSSPKKEKRYQLQEFSPHKIFPISKEDLDIDTFSYEALYEKMSQFLKVFEPNNFKELYNGLWNIFRQFLWAVPSYTWKTHSDISLFDHLSTTSAIAAVLYQYHQDNFDEKEIRDINSEKFLLVGGDLSGIQEFLFEISPRNPKKLSKTLRGRSFFISLLMEMAALKVLTALQLPYSCKIMSAGGKFIILAPNRDDIKKTLGGLSNEIEEEFFKLFLGKITLNLTYSTRLNGRDFKAGVFKEKVTRVNDELNQKKRQKNVHIFKNERHLETLNKAQGQNLQENQLCSFCGVFPATHLGEEARCKICQDSENFGNHIIDKDFLLFTQNTNGFNFLGIGVEFSTQYKENLLAYSLKDTASLNPYPGSIFHSVANFIPRDTQNQIKRNNEDPNSFCFHCARNNLETKCNIDDREGMQKNYLSFDCMAASARLRNRGKGINRLAILKMDIDNLGYIIRFGFENNISKKKYSKYSISRFTFLSRMIDAFFQYWMKEMIVKEFPMIYTVYAGGDDLLLIGPWLDIIAFSVEIQNSFKSFVGDNPDINLSAGISLFSPHTPVKGAAQNSQEFLEKSKEQQGKNSLTIFDTTVKWEQFQELSEYAKYLDESVNKNEENSRINTSFLFRLFKYRRMFLESELGQIEGLRFHSLMNYDVVRNIQIKEQNKIKNQEEIEKWLLPLYATGEVFNKELLKNLIIPLYITLFKNRGGKN